MPITVSNGETVSPDAAPGENDQKALEQAENELRGALEKVRRQRAVVQQQITKAPAGEDYFVERNAAAKVQELEDEIDTVLQSPPEVRTMSLRALAGRLAVKHGFQIGPDRDKTPTISTLVQHRQQ